MNQGYRKFPPGVYFNGDFTITFWIFLKNSGHGTGIFDFANGQRNNNFYIALQMHNFIGIRSCLCDSTVCNPDLRSMGALQLNKWYFISVVLENRSLMIYINGELNVKAIFPSNLPSNVLRNSNYIGAHNWAQGSSNNLNGTIDDLKIFNRSLNQTEINKEMNSIF